MGSARLSIETGKNGVVAGGEVEQSVEKQGRRYIARVRDGWYLDLRKGE